MAKKVLTITINKRRNEWRWQMCARNGLIVGASTEGYKRIARCLENLLAVTGIEIQAFAVNKKAKTPEKARYFVSDVRPRLYNMWPKL